MTTNVSENFNDVLKGARVLPIQALIVRIFSRLVKFFQTGQKNAERWCTPLTLKNEDLLRYRTNMV